MKNSKLMLAVGFAFFILLTPAFAQTTTIRVAVPFDFSVGKQTLPAGDYLVTVNGKSLLQLARKDGPGVATAMTNYTGGGPNQNLTPRLIFHRYGEHCFLSEAWIGEGNQGHELFASGAELEYARANHQERTVVLASRMDTK